MEKRALRIARKMKLRLAENGARTRATAKEIGAGSQVPRTALDECVDGEDKGRGCRQTLGRMVLGVEREGAEMPESRGER
jgi:hypothetical protein